MSTVADILLQATKSLLSLPFPKKTSHCTNTLIFASQMCTYITAIRAINLSTLDQPSKTVHILCMLDSMSGSITAYRSTLK